MCELWPPWGFSVNHSGGGAQSRPRTARPPGVLRVPVSAAHAHKGGLRPSSRQRPAPAHAATQLPLVLSVSTCDTPSRAGRRPKKRCRVASPRTLGKYHSALSWRTTASIRTGDAVSVTAPGRSLPPSVDHYSRNVSPSAIVSRRSPIGDQIKQSNHPISTSPR